MKKEILELLARQEELVKIQKTTEKEIKEIRRTLGDYERTVRPTSRYAVSAVRTKMIDNTEYVVITEELQNLSDKERHSELFGGVWGDWKEARHSVQYYRKGTVLTHTGGGYIMLDDCQICSDDEWLDIKNGKFGKFKRKQVNNDASV